LSATLRTSNHPILLLVLYKKSSANSKGNVRQRCMCEGPGSNEI